MDLEAHIVIWRVTIYKQNPSAEDGRTSPVLFKNKNINKYYTALVHFPV